jgi:hypothetical protein
MPSRPVFVCRVYFGPWEEEGSRATSEPETALPLTTGKQGAGAAQHRPRCRSIQLDFGTRQAQRSTPRGRPQPKTRNRQLWYSVKDVQPARFTRVIDFAEVAGASVDLVA